MQYTPIDKLGGDLNSHLGDTAGPADRVDHQVHDDGIAALENGKDGAAILRKRVASRPIPAIAIATAAGAFFAGLMFRK